MARQPTCSSHINMEDPRLYQLYMQSYHKANHVLLDALLNGLAIGSRFQQASRYLQLMACVSSYRGEHGYLPKSAEKWPWRDDVCLVIMHGRWCWLPSLLFRVLPARDDDSKWHAWVDIAPNPPLPSINKHRNLYRHEIPSSVYLLMASIPPSRDNKPGITE